MADWRQIQARIRKAKGAADATAKLSELYERTRDAMVAFELAQLHEKAGEHAEAAKWYTAAAERFRRAQWRTKAEEALTRLGAPIPPAAPAGASQTKAADMTPAEEEISSTLDIALPGEPEGPEEEESTELLPAGAATPTPVPASEPGGRKRRRRGRRGGRGRRRGQRPAEAAAPSQEVASPRASGFAEPEARPEPVAEMPQTMPSHREPEHRPEPVTEITRGYERPASGLWHGRGSRAGDPALASRMAQLESQLRRLLACPISSLEDVEQAPAGPGVLLLSDSDQVTHYYVEACQTLRIGVGNLLRGGRGSREAGRLKELMAENLGIGESQVAKYMKDHCGVRWLQLDEGAAELAHFAIAVLRPVARE